MCSSQYGLAAMPDIRVVCSAGPPAFEQARTKKCPKHHEGLGTSLGQLDPEITLNSYACPFRVMQCNCMI